MAALLQQTISELVAPNKGILAADESNGTMGKRLQSIGVENTESNRSDFRALLATAEKLGEHISGVILFEETFNQNTAQGENIASVFARQGSVPGIKVDKGLVSFATNPDEQITQGLDGLPERLESFKAKGARFAKWRAVYTVSDVLPSCSLVHANAELLARYAAICQAHDIVPIVEPEVLMDGDHTLERCAEVTEMVLRSVFAALAQHQVQLEYIILKPNMVIPGKECRNQRQAKDIAEWTLRTLRRTVPAAVPSINFLSGGQSPDEATKNLNAINSCGPQPWQLSFSYGRALQETRLKVWGGAQNQWLAAQQALLTCAKNNGAATKGEYQEQR